jgi:hypothetical protein
MKAKVIDIEGIGKAILGKADGASIEEILNSIKKDIAEAANESEDKEYHECMINLIENGIEGAKEANKTVAEFVASQVKEIFKKEIDCFCPYCVMKIIESVTEEDIIKYGKANVEIICDGLGDTLKHQMKVVRDRINNKLRWIEEGNHAAKSYEDMTKEELIAELKKQK